jgi:hypothetical protein
MLIHVPMKPAAESGYASVYLTCFLLGMVRNKMFYRHCFKNAIRRVKVIKDGLKLNGTYQLLVYVDDVNILEGSVHTIKSCNSG